MKILTYNIHRCNQEKIDKILQRSADIMVLPECACPDQISLPEGYEMTWIGNYDFKGLGVIWKSTVKCSVAPWADAEHKYMMPLIVNVYTALFLYLNISKLCFLLEAVQAAVEE